MPSRILCLRPARTPLAQTGPVALTACCRAASVLLAVGLLSACGGGGGGGSGTSVAPDQANARVAITNTPFFLDARVINTSEAVAIDAPPPVAPVMAGDSPPALNAAGVSLTLVREIDPPVVEGEVVQATSIWLKSASQAVVSYNMVGAPRLGAIDYITNINQKKPTLSSSVAFNDSDISAVSTDGSWVYAAEATNDPAFPFPSVLERFKVQGQNLVLQDNSRLALTSFAATSTMATNNAVYATSGSTGEVFAFGTNDLSPLGQFPLDDARWVDWDQTGGRIVVAQGAPPNMPPDMQGKLSVFAEGQFPGGSMTLLNTFQFLGADVPESKTTVEIAGGKAFIAAGPQGVQIMCLDDGSIVGSVPRPDPAALGLDPAVVMTNAVTVDGDLMFISNGEAGVYVAQADADFNASPCNTPLQITMLGHLQFDDLQSANHVAYKNDYLFVAAGLGGVKIVEVDNLN